MNISSQDDVTVNLMKETSMRRITVTSSVSETSMEQLGKGVSLLFFQEWGVLTEKPDWVFGAELVCCGSELYTIGGVSSRQVDRYGHGLINNNYN